MLGIHDLGLFIISGLLLNIMPGPDSLLIMTRSASQGWGAGSQAALGIGSGTLVHVFAAALGMSAILATSAAAFAVVKLIGALYLLYLGCKMLFCRAPATPESQPKAEQSHLPYKKIFLQGLMTNVLNPKVALFFLAFVPQFISPDSQHKALAFIALGLIFDINGMLWCHFLAAFSSVASKKIKLNQRLLNWINRAIGGLFIGFGIKLAISKQ